VILRRLILALLVLACGDPDAAALPPADAEFARIEQAYRRDPPSQDLVDRFYDFMSAYPKDPRCDQVQYWAGLTQQKRRYHNEAIKEFGYLVSEFPRSPLVTPALRAQAESYRAIDKPQKADEVFRSIHERRPRDLRNADAAVVAAVRDAILHIASAHAAAKELDAAVALYMELPDRADAISRIVSLLIANDRHEEALETVKRLPDSERFLGYQLAISVYATRPGTANLFKIMDGVIGREKPQSAVDAVVQQAVAAIARKGPPDHERALDRVAATYPPLKRWAQYGLCELHKADDPARLLRFIGDYRKGPDVEQVKLWNAEYWMAANQPDKAREAYWLLDDKPAAHFLVAETYYGKLAKNPDLAGGERELSEIVRRFYSPATSCEALMRRAALQAAAMKDPQAAEKSLRELLERFPAEGEYPPKALMELGRLLRGQNRHADAMAAYEKLIFAYPNSHLLREAWMAVAATHEEARRPERAIEVYQSILRKFPRTREASRAHTILEQRYKIPDTDVADR